MEASATAQPHSGGFHWPSSLATGGTHITMSEKASSMSTAGTKSRLVNQPSDPGQREEDRQAKTFAV